MQRDSPTNLLSPQAGSCIETTCCDTVATLLYYVQLQHLTPADSCLNVWELDDIPRFELPNPISFLVLGQHLRFLYSLFGWK